MTSSGEKEGGVRLSAGAKEIAGKEDDMFPAMGFFTAYADSVREKLRRERLLKRYPPAGAGSEHGEA